MSTTDRIAPSAGWVNPSALPKGPNGRNLCRWCQREVEGSRKTFCSDDCVHQHKLRSQPGYVRRLVYDRDRGICAVCGVDSEARGLLLRKRFLAVNRKLTDKSHRMATSNWSRWQWVDRRQKVWKRRTGFGKTSHAWEADHIVPVVEGGGGCGLESYRTLCIACHKAATKSLRGRMRDRRKEVA